MADERESKLQSLKNAIDQIEKQHGKGSVMRLGEGPIQQVEVISTGSISLDAALGIGGIPRGRVIEIFGPESSGKTTLCLHIVAEAQKNAGICAFIDAEHALDMAYAKKLGVDVNNLLLSQPEFGEQGLEITETLVRSNALDVIVIDSVAALTPRAEIEGEMGDPSMGVQARLMSQALRKLTSAISKSKTSVIFTNQLRMKIGVMFGNPETTTGGNALKFYASVRLDVRRIEAIKDGTNVIGNRTRVKVVKNKVAPPFREAQFDILYNEGISKIGDLIDTAVEHNIIAKAGSWFSYKEERIGQGRDSVKKFLQENLNIAKEIDAAMRTKLGLTGSNGSQPTNGNATAPTAKSATTAPAKPAVTPVVSTGKPPVTVKKT
ncbi:MAG: recombinase RecA [Bacteroidetes bacterium]|nr:recombinase RecA [Bacteroidota bacterium]MCW5894370.1 recombinase RecA [Bacteroidota bacterium]